MYKRVMFILVFLFVCLFIFSEGVYAAEEDLLDSIIEDTNNGNSLNKTEMSNNTVHVEKSDQVMNGSNENTETVDLSKSQDNSSTTSNGAGIDDDYSGEELTETDTYNLSDNTQDLNYENQNHDQLDSSSNQSEEYNDNSFQEDDNAQNVNDTKFSDSSSSDFDSVLSLLEKLSVGVLFVIPLIFLLLVVISGLMIVSKGKIYEKAGYYAWKSVVPLYNNYVLFQFTWGNGWFFILSLIPVIGFIVMLITKWKLNAAFGGNGISFVILLLLPFIMLPSMAFSESAIYDGDYEGDDI